MFSTPILNYFRPHEILYKIVPNFNYLMVFRSLCCVNNLSTNRRNFDPRASKRVFIDFKRRTKGYALLNIQSREILCLEMLSSKNIFFYIKDTSNETDSPNIHIKVLLPKINLF